MLQFFVVFLKCTLEKGLECFQQDVTPYDLAKRWNIGLETAKETLLRTTQRDENFTKSFVVSMYGTNDRMLRYRRLPLDLFTDTLEAGIVSHRGNKYAQGYAHRNTW